jgi:tRNA U34 2-thiouridine synthase MnmA/TrmU
MTTPRKAVALISGGLDSMLAARVMLEQGIHVEGINFFTGFCVEGHTHAIRRQDKNKPKRNNALWTAEQLGIKLHIIDVIEEYKDIVINPKHGYGAHINPCLDCKGFMVKKAREWIEENNFDFIITGEVVGQRPMSQRKDTMPIIAAESGAHDRLLRPLCARNLPVTLPEQQGWVDRERLYGFSGRSRKPQMALARQFGISDYAQPAGGCCFLTDAAYSTKLQDLWQQRGEKTYEIDDIMLLKVGRHLRPRPHFKLIIGREEGENRFLEGYRRQFTTLQASKHNGPLVLLDGSHDDNDLHLAARIVARYCQSRNTDSVDIDINPRDMANAHTLSVSPMNNEDILPEWYV